MSRKVLLILALVLLHSATASGQWFDAAWVCRRSVKITETKADGKDAEVASVVFSPGDLLTLDGRDIRVVTKSGKEVPLVVITADPSAECRVLFKIQPGVTEYHVYYGNLKAEAPKYGWRPRTGILLLEVPNPPGGFRGNNFVQHVD
ncbi:MAG: hypothetical protein QF662_04980, partial [Phycisphaerae bacterium]|nr:hypothetical protein [Phycisphaerae bacterium]